MNTVDYESNGGHVSRLELVKSALREGLRRLPCGSRIGLGLFTERESAILFQPVEVCGNYSAIDGAIARIDWRMAWAADSNIAQGLYNTIKLLKGFNTHLVFMTDGHEAPPINSRYQPDFKELTGEVEGARILATMQPASEPRFDERPGVVKGLIVGVGAYTLTPIPKFNEEGEQIGFYSADDVPHASRFGLPIEDPGNSRGYDPRNAPFGSEAAVGNEHLSSVRESYLKGLGAQTGLVYHHLESSSALSAALQADTFAERILVAADVRWIPALVALLILVFLYGMVPRMARWLGDGHLPTRGHTL
ncbi:MAG: VWA domain-containing protein [Pseudomonadota bacterium]|nr:VWA domain-containing protein [Pseudomonadota bacterium]